MVGPEQFLAPSLWIRNTVLTGTSNHKNGWEKQQVLLSVWHKRTHKGGRIAGQRRWQGQTICQPSPMSSESSSAGPHAPRLTTTCPPGMSHPQLPHNIHPSHRGPISQSAFIQKELKAFGNCCTTKHFPGFSVNISVPGEPINTRQWFRHRGRRGLEDTACQFSSAAYEFLGGVCCKQKAVQNLLIRWDLPISTLTVV